MNLQKRFDVGTYAVTILVAILLMIVVILCLSIGWIITGKMKLKRGTCGMLQNDKEKTETCSICGAQKICEKQDHEEQ